MHKSDKCATLYRQPDRCGNAKIIISATSPKLTKIRGENIEAKRQTNSLKLNIPNPCAPFTNICTPSGFIGN